MQRTTDGAAPTARAGKGNRQMIASLAHAKAHEAAALNAALGQIDDGMTAEQIRTLLVRMIRTRHNDVALMADEVIGHA